MLQDNKWHIIEKILVIVLSFEHCILNNVNYLFKKSHYLFMKNVHMYKPCTASIYNLVFYTYNIVIILIQKASHKVVYNYLLYFVLCDIC